MGCVKCTPSYDYSLLNTKISQLMTISNKLIWCMGRQLMQYITETITFIANPSLLTEEQPAISRSLQRSTEKLTDIDIKPWLPLLPLLPVLHWAAVLPALSWLHSVHIQHPLRRCNHHLVHSINTKKGQAQ